MITLVLATAMFAADPPPKVLAPVKKTKAYWAQLRRERAQRSLGKKKAARDLAKQGKEDAQRMRRNSIPPYLRQDNDAPPLRARIVGPGSQRLPDGRRWMGNFWWPRGGHRPIATYD